MLKKIMIILAISFSAAATAAQTNFIQDIRNNAYEIKDAKPVNYSKWIVKYYGDVNKLKRLYRDFRIKAIYNHAGVVDHLIVIKNKLKTHGFDIDRINLLGKQEKVIHYRPTQLDMQQLSDVNTPHCPDSRATFVISSYNYSDDTRKVMSSPALDEIALVAKKAGYNIVTLFDSKAIAQNILNYMSCPNVTAMHDTGDGDHDLIETTDGFLSAGEIKKYLPNKLTGKTVYFNDCLVASPGDGSMKDAIMNNGAQAFLGGITTLSILTTDDAGACFWHQAMQKKDMKAANTFCQNQYDYDPFGFGDGVTGYFSNGNNELSGVINPLKQSAWGAFAAGGMNAAGRVIVGNRIQINDATDQLAAAKAAEFAQSQCANNGGTGCHLKRNDAQFQNCGAAYVTLNGADKGRVFFGFGDAPKIASKQSALACQFDRQSCQSVFKKIRCSGNVQ